MHMEMFQMAYNSWYLIVVAFISVVAIVYLSNLSNTSLWHGKM